ncbi:MAG: cob(I)yrinic acid a,c-diamide adenosyltransferase [Nitrospiraceae bacterium]|nr:cob(I)yrinic acid a,c-diamide adenosyltransferase [Nitrospiraceae bacterium]
MRRGYVQVYTGNGKGKTTAALGLALRAAGARHKVFIAQFIKKRMCSEHRALERFSDFITAKQYGKGLILNRQATALDIAAAQKGLEEARLVMLSRDYDVIILDEANVAVKRGLISVETLLELIKNKPARLELVITGRYADEKIIEAADLVTEMKEIKHYSNKGVKARVGIEK